MCEGIMDPDDPRYSCDCHLREVIGNCTWCSEPIYSDQEYEEGDDGEGVMHSQCFADTFMDDEPSGGPV